MTVAVNTIDLFFIDYMTVQAVLVWSGGRGGETLLILGPNRGKLIRGGRGVNREGGVYLK